jgi:hypothetical protein
MNNQNAMLAHAGVLPASVPPTAGARMSNAASAAAARPVRRFTHKPTRTVVVDLSAARAIDGTGANAPLVIPFDGSLIHCPWSTNADDLAMVSLDDDSGAIPITRHYSCSGNAYSKLTITNDAVAGAKLYLVLALESLEERLLVL